MRKTIKIKRFFATIMVLSLANTHISAKTHKKKLVDKKELKSFIKEKNILFISPHPDDIPLTFGGLIEGLGGMQDKNVQYAVFFNLSQYTTNQQANNQSNSRVNRVTNDRHMDDRSALTLLFKSWKNFRMESYGFPDAPLRNYVGPKTVSGGPGGDFSDFRKTEMDTYQQIINILIPKLQTEDCAIFLLMANGSHIDHFIVREALIKAVSILGAKTKCKIYFGEDQPYTGLNLEKSSQEINTLAKRLHLKPLTYTIDIDHKIKIFSDHYMNQYDDDYIEGLKESYKNLNGGERIYLWPNKYYNNIPLDASFKKKNIK